MTTAASGGTVRSTGHGGLAFRPGTPCAADAPFLEPGTAGAEPARSSSIATGSMKSFSKSASSASASAGSGGSVGCSHDPQGLAQAQAGTRCSSSEELAVAGRLSNHRRIQTVRFMCSLHSLIKAHLLQVKPHLQQQGVLHRGDGHGAGPPCRRLVNERRPRCARPAGVARPRRHHVQGGDALQHPPDARSQLRRLQQGDAPTASGRGMHCNLLRSLHLRFCSPQEHAHQGVVDQDRWVNENLTCNRRSELCLA